MGMSCLETVAGSDGSRHNQGPVNFPLLNTQPLQWERSKRMPAELSLSGSVSSQQAEAGHVQLQLIAHSNPIQPRQNETGTILFATVSETINQLPDGSA